MAIPSLLQLRPAISTPLDPAFIPASLAHRRYREYVASADETTTLAIALERENGLLSRHDLSILAPGTPYDADTLRIVGRHIKCLVWAKGGWKLYLNGPASLCASLKAQYIPGGIREFDAMMMQRVYNHPFTMVEVPDAAEMPAPHEATSTIGGHLEGCRIGFDLGASDYKLAAVMDGEAVFSTEIPWNPAVQTDPQYHYRHLCDGLRLAAAKLPRVDAIGGSSAGIYVANQPKVASLFRAVPDAQFVREIMPMFQRLQHEWGVPLVVINDGDVTALAGAMSLKQHAMLGLAMGSSEAAGYLNPQGHITGYLNELAFAPVDFNPHTMAEDWSGDLGVGAMYFSQQAVNKLAPAAGITFPADMPLPERLKVVQSRANAGDAAAQQIFTTIGVYLGYALPYYAEYYDFEHVLIVGRVTSGRGGELIVRHAQEVLQREFPEFAKTIAIHVPDEQSRRVGQAVAAASLPEITENPNL